MLIINQSKKNELPVTTEKLYRTMHKILSIGHCESQCSSQSISPACWANSGKPAAASLLLWTHPRTDRWTDRQTDAVHAVSLQLSDTIVRFLILLMYARCFHSVYYEVNMHMCFQCLTLLVGRQEGHSACKKTERWGAGMVVCLVLPFWYWLTRVIPDKGPLNGCVCVRACVCV